MLFEVIILFQSTSSVIKAFFYNYFFKVVYIRIKMSRFKIKL